MESTKAPVTHEGMPVLNNELAIIKLEVYIGYWHDFEIYENGFLKFESKYLGYQSFWDAPNWQEDEVSHIDAKKAIRYSKELMSKVGAKDFKEFFKKLSFTQINKYPYRFDRYACIYIR
jgi:hypothetical protein